MQPANFVHTEGQLLLDGACWGAYATKNLPGDAAIAAAVLLLLLHGACSVYDAYCTGGAVLAPRAPALADPAQLGSSCCCC
jgi:hypothetical protein